ncbi:MAG: YggS family pyridoxal phosphate-dependent enzyme [Candidatus Aminicenantes bacterium]|nr:YggS family pyridoxal phosphate-dependent enzyme [Candidatus Aminicenantes bacterium]
MQGLRSRLDSLLAEIDRTARSCGRDGRDIQLLAVTKVFPAAVVSHAAGAGQIRFGENRVQEAAAKIPAVGDSALEWHLIGHLQSNKVRRAVQLFDVIQTLDSEKLVSRVARCAREMGKALPVYIQVNLGREAQKYGVGPGAAGQLVRLVDRSPPLVLRGLMAIPPYAADPEASRPYFRQLARLAREISRTRPEPVTGLSMGMSHDYRVAIEEGATLLRIGSKLFGKRPS